MFHHHHHQYLVYHLRQLNHQLLVEFFTLPHPGCGGRAVPAVALLGEAVQSVDPADLVVAPDHIQLGRILYLVRQQQRQAVNPLPAARPGPRSGRTLGPRST